jgi:ABC-type branched-subunit amino acid transport system permease subunit
MIRAFPKRELRIVGLIAFIGLVLLPCLNAFVPPTNPFYINTFTLSLYGKYLTYAVLAMGVNLLWGYTGILSLGQCVFFALGGYALGMYLMLLIAKLGQYRADLPDFMVFLEFATKYPTTSGLPRHWIPFHSVWFAAAAVVWVPALVALIFGFLAFRSRIKGVYFSILSQALTYAMCLMFFRNDFTFGGNNGLTDFKYILGTPVLTADELKDPPALVARLKAGNDAVSKFLADQLSGDTQKQLADYSGGEPSGVLKSNLVHNLNLFISTRPLYEKERFVGVTLPREVAARTSENLKDAPMLQFNRELLEAVYAKEIAPKGFAGYVINAPATKRALYICSGLLLLLTYCFCRWLTSTKFGLIQRAIRDSENRVLFSGYATANFKLFVFVTAAIISALGGALFVPQVGIINPSEMAPDKSLEAVVWVAVGGRGNMLGPILGAVGINALKSYATHAFAEQWPYILGFLFIFVTIFMPKGIIGLPEQFRALWQRYAHKPLKDEVIAQPEGVTQLFYRERQFGKQAGERSHQPPSAAPAEPTRPEP